MTKEANKELKQLVPREGYTIERVMRAIRVQANLNEVKSGFPGYEGRSLGSFALLSEVKRDTASGAATWEIGKGMVGIYTLSENATKQQLEELNPGVMAIRRSSSRPCIEYLTKTLNGRWLSAWVEDLSVVRPPVCLQDDMQKVAALLEVEPNAEFVELFNAALGRV